MYSVLVPITMFGWIFVTISLFSRLVPTKAVVISVIGGVLLLPMASYDIPLIPEYNKYTAISIGLLLGGYFSGNYKKYPLKMTVFDIPMICWCFIVPFATTFSNSLSLKDGMSYMLSNYLQWGVFFWTGRRYFSEAASLRILTWGILIGGMIYLPLILFEVRMSPQLSNIVYGFFPASFLQHIRYGAYRPIVFMQHGLMVSLWMAIATMAAFWLWRSGEVKKIGSIPSAVITIALIGATILCKSANGWFTLAMGIGTFFYYKLAKSTSVFRFAMIAILLYMFFRATAVISMEKIQSLAGLLFDVERIASLTWRLQQEDLFCARALLRPLFGWGGYGRGWPVDLDTGARLIRMVDSFWVITYSTYGAFGLVSVYLSLGLGSWCVLKKYDTKSITAIRRESIFTTDIIILCLILIFFMVDSLLNAMVNPIYILVSGVIISSYLVMGSHSDELVIPIADGV